MRRLQLLMVTFVGAIAIGGLGGCDKPTFEDCRAAVTNMGRLLGTDISGERTADTESEVRRCKGGSSKKSVTCRKNATTLAELKACDASTKK